MSVGPSFTIWSFILFGMLGGKRHDLIQSLCLHSYFSSLGCCTSIFKGWWSELFFFSMIGLFSWPLTLTQIRLDVLTLAVLVQVFGSSLVFLWLPGSARNNKLFMFYCSWISCRNLHYCWDYLASLATCWYRCYAPRPNSSILCQCKCQAYCSQS